MNTEREFSRQMQGMSAQQLRALAQTATAMAADLEKDLPSYDLALAAGVEDHSYRSARDGWIPSYRGEGIVTLASGKRFRCIGHRNFGGDAYTAIPNGFIEFVPMAKESLATTE